MTSSRATTAAATSDRQPRTRGSSRSRPQSSWTRSSASSSPRKRAVTVLGLALYREAGLPAGYSQFVDFYKNTDAVGTQRCEITDADEETVAQYQREQKQANPQNPPSFDGLGIIYKSKGLDGDEGPYGWANGQPMPATGCLERA
jgi:hypothetical protein